MKKNWIPWDEQKVTNTQRSRNTHPQAWPFILPSLLLLAQKTIIKTLLCWGLALPNGRDATARGKKRQNLRYQKWIRKLLLLWLFWFHLSGHKCDYGIIPKGSLSLSPFIFFNIRVLSFWQNGRKHHCFFYKCYKKRIDYFRCFYKRSFESLTLVWVINSVINI